MFWPMQATRSGPVLTTFALPLSPSLGPRSQLEVSSRRTHAILDLTRFLDANRFPLRLKTLRYFQLTPIDSTAALAMRKSVSQSPPLPPTPPIHWPSISTGTPTFHGRPSLRSGGERKTDRVADVEVLTGRSLGRGRAPVRRGAHRLGGAGVHGMETTAVHAFEQDHVPAGIHDRARDRDPGLAGHVDRRRHDLLRALMREALALGDIHSRSPNLRRTRGVCASVLAPSRHFHSGCAHGGIFPFRETAAGNRS